MHGALTTDSVQMDTADHHWFIKTVMFFILFSSEIFSPSLSLSPRQFHFINTRKNWTEAQSFCRGMFSDLATVNSTEEMDSLVSNITATTSQNVYIGLRRTDVFSWHWSLPNSSVDFSNWKQGQPNTNANQEGCAVMENNGKWTEDNCSTQRQFICFNENSSSNTLVQVKRSWRDAQEYCRNVYTDLTSVRNSSENQAVNQVAKSQQVWIGLFKDSWAWSDGSDSSYRFWKSTQPSNVIGQDCAVADMNQTGRWNDVRCTHTNFFICQKAENSTQTPTQTEVPVTSTAKSSTQDTGATSATSQTSTLQSTSHSTEKSTTQTPTPQTTDGQTTNNTVSQQTTQTTAVPQTTNIQTQPPDNLILVKQDLTWTEAVRYCREHHVDLVSVLTEEQQKRVEKKSSLASSSHVWMGLSYSCTFNFWFWIRNRETSCYQNWAPGQGTEKPSDCGLAGAIESSGEQRWVRKPQNERLNFICITCDLCQTCTT